MYNTLDCINYGPDDRIKFLSLGSSSYSSTGTSLEYVGIEFTIPSSRYALVQYITSWNSGRPVLLSISPRDNDPDRSALVSESANLDISVEGISGVLSSGTYRCYCKRAGSSTAPNTYSVRGHIFK